MIPTSEDETSLTEPLLLSSSIYAHYISSVGDIENISECTYENFETDVTSPDYSWKKFASSGNKVTNLSRKNKRRLWEFCCIMNSGERSRWLTIGYLTAAFMIFIFTKYIIGSCK